jgi:hypothetical protein
MFLLIHLIVSIAENAFWLAIYSRQKNSSPAGLLVESWRQNLFKLNLAQI